MTILVPRGPEAAAVKRGRPEARIVELAAGAAAGAALPALHEPVVALGLCGALRDRAVGDVVIYRRVSDGDDTVMLEPDLVAVLAGAIPMARVANACSTDHVVTTARERAELARRHDADVVDMEGAALAAALSRRRLRYAMVRVVSDTAARDVPALERAITADGGLDRVRIALAFIRRPRAAAAFVRDVRTALAVLSRVAGEVRTDPVRE